MQLIHVIIFFCSIPVYMVAYYVYVFTKFKIERKNATKILGREFMDRLFDRYKSNEDASKGKNSDLSIDDVEFEELDFSVGGEVLLNLEEGFKRIVKIMIER